MKMTRQSHDLRQRLEMSLKAKSIHHLEFDVERYLATLRIPRQNLEETLDWMVNRVSPRGDTIRVLIVGPGSGRIEVPFLIRLEAAFPQTPIQVEFIDCNEDSVEQLRNTLREHDFTPDPAQDNRFTKATLTCSLVQDDFERWPSESANWDILVAFFVVSFFSEWLLSLQRMLSLLAEGGCLFLSQDSGDIRFVDNTFEPIDRGMSDALQSRREDDRSVFYRLWREYYSVREELGYPWQPLISPSDMQVAKSVLTRIEESGFGDLALFSTVWESEDLSWDDWLHHMHDWQVFNCLCTIPSSLRHNLAEGLRTWLSKMAGIRDFSSRPMLKIGHEIWAFTARGDQDTRLRSIERIASDVYRSLILEKLSERRPFRAVLQSDASMGRQLARVVSVHTQLPIYSEATLGLVSWQLEDLADPAKGKWYAEVPIVIAGSLTVNRHYRRRYLASYAVYMCLTQYRREERGDIELLSDLLLHRLPVKLLVAYAISSADAVLGGECDARIRYSRNGNVSGVECFLDTHNVRTIRQDTSTILDQATTLWNESSSAESDFRFDFPRLGAVRLTDIQSLAESIWRSHRELLCMLFRKCETAASKLAILTEAALREAVARDERLAALVDATDKTIATVAKHLAFLGYANTIVSAGVQGYEWKRFLFVPSRNLEGKRKRLDRSAKRDPWETGVLGFAYYESIDSRSQSAERDVEIVLRVRADIFGLEDAILEYGRLVRQEAESSAKAAIMSRNMSHNVGSHVLAGLTTEVITSRSPDIERLVQYVQERMDFVARVATKWPSWQEPVLFLSDLLRGFLKQGLLLDYLIRDEGYKAEQITLYVKCPRSESWVVYKYHNGEAAAADDEDRFSEFRPTSSVGASDFLVAVPGGTVGKQALYGFLENALRNAAKHNPQRKSLTFVLEVVTFGEVTTGSTLPGAARFLQVTYLDDLSTNELSRPLVKKMQAKIKAPVIDRDTGKLTSQNWGVQEMKVYADFLAHPFTRGADEWFVYEDEDTDRERQRLRLWARAATVPSVCSTMPSPNNVLSYSFGVQRATLALVVSPESLTATDQEILTNESLGLEFRCGTPNDELLNWVRLCSSALLHLTVPHEEIDGVLKWIRDNENDLPARILIRTQPNSEGLDEHIASSRLTRRVHVDPVTLPLLAAVDKRDETSSEERAKRLLVELYRRWILAFADARDYRHPFNIVIYFDRTNQSLPQRWANLGETVREYGLDKLVRVFPSYKSEDPIGAREILPWTAVARASSDYFRLREDEREGTWLVFDNHGAARIEGIVEAFYQYIGGKSEGLPNNRDMFERLANVPEGIAGILFLLHIVEACLLKVLLVDERVVGTMITVSDPPCHYEWTESDNTLLGQFLAVFMTKAGLAFIPFINVNGRRISVLRTQGEVLWNFEGTRRAGLDLQDSEVVRCEAVAWTGKEIGLKEFIVNSSNPPPFDTVVIHRGLVEILAGELEHSGSPLNVGRFLNSLRRVGTRVVITSGRGAQVDGPYADWPFVEFSAIESFVVRELSKLSMGSVMMAVTGKGDTCA